MNILGKTKETDENKSYLLELEKRLANLESSVQNVSQGLQRGNLMPEQEQRVSRVEERLENVEDLQMVANIDLIKLREAVEKIHSEGGFAPAAVTANSSLQRKVGEIENFANMLGRKIDSIESSRALGNAEGGGSQSGLDDIRDDLESFKKETEETIKIIVASIRKLAERTKR